MVRRVVLNILIVVTFGQLLFLRRVLDTNLKIELVKLKFESIMTF